MYQHVVWRAEFVRDRVWFEAVGLVGYELLVGLWARFSLRLMVVLPVSFLFRLL